MWLDLFRAGGGILNYGGTDFIPSPIPKNATSVHRPPSRLEQLLKPLDGTKLNIRRGTSTVGAAGATPAGHQPHDKRMGRAIRLASPISAYRLQRARWSRRSGKSIVRNAPSPAESVHSANPRLCLQKTPYQQHYPPPIGRHGQLYDLTSIKSPGFRTFT